MSAERAIPAPLEPPTLIRALGRWTVTALVLNCVIGSGIFGLPDDVARLVGSAAPLAYVVAALAVAAIVAAFAEVASQFKDTGGPYLYAREAFGPLTGIQTAWFSALARVASNAAVAHIFVSYLGEFWPGIAAPMPRTIVLVALIGGLAFVNVRGVRQGGGLNNVLTIAKLVPLVLFVLAGLALAPRIASAGPAVVPTAASWIDALIVLLFAFGGFESAFFAAGEAKNPRRDAPFALFVGLATVTVIYLAVHVVSMWSVPNLAGSERPLADAARVFAGNGGAALISLGAAFSTFGALCGAAVTAPRIIFALGERGDLPRFFGAIHPRFRTPHISILFWAAIVLGLALWGNFIWNAVLSVAARLVSYGVTCAALIRLRRQRPGADAWRAPAGNLLALVGIGFCVLLVSRLTGPHAKIMAGVAAVAALNWFVFRPRQPAPLPVETA